MDIVGLSTALSSVQISNDIQVAMLSKSLDTLEDMGDGMTKMLEQSVNPHIGQHIDYLV